MTTKLRTEEKYEFEKDIFKLMNNSIFLITMEDFRKYEDIKLINTSKRRN